MYFKSVENQRKFLENIAEEFNIKNMEEWKNVTIDKVKERGGQPLLRKFNGSLHGFL